MNEKHNLDLQVTIEKGISKKFGKPYYILRVSSGVKILDMNINNIFINEVVYNELLLNHKKK